MSNDGDVDRMIYSDVGKYCMIPGLLVLDNLVLNLELDFPLYVLTFAKPHQCLHLLIVVSLYIDSPLRHDMIECQAVR